MMLKILKQFQLKVKVKVKVKVKIVILKRKKQKRKKIKNGLILYGNIHILHVFTRLHIEQHSFLGIGL